MKIAAELGLELSVCLFSCDVNADLFNSIDDYEMDNVLIHTSSLKRYILKDKELDLVRQILYFLLDIPSLLICPSNKMIFTAIF